RTTRTRTCPVRRFTRGSDQQCSMTEECGWPHTGRGREPHRKRCDRNYVCDRHGRVDGDLCRDLLALILNQPDGIQSMERPLLAAALQADLCLLWRVRLGTTDDFLPCVAAEQARAGHRRSGDESQERNKGGGT